MSEDAGTKRGRPVGVGAVARLRRELLKDGQLEQLIAKTVGMALDGDVAAIRILLDRSIPALRPQSAPVSVALPAGSLTDQARAILAAAAAGEIPADVASELIRAIAAAVNIEQQDEVRRRLDAMEYGDLA